MEEIKRSKDIKGAIARAIVFFDLLDYPLTSYEIWKNLFFNSPQADVCASLNEVIKILDSGEMEESLGCKNGLYYLTGREALVEARLKNYNLISKKYQTALAVVRWLRFIPGVRMVAACNSLALGNVKEESDIDFFIVTAKDRIWLTRALVTAAVQAQGIRRHDKKISDRVCLSFYVTEENLDLKDIALDSDPYLYYWIASLVPIFDEACYARFFEMNAWVKKYLPNFIPVAPGLEHKTRDPGGMRLYGKINSIWFDSFFGAWLERAARLLQLKKMSKNTHSVAREDDTRVIISDTMLKFHEMDRREEYRRRWEAGIKKLPA